MPTKVEIEGVGIVEVDDNFASLDPASQDRTIKEITASLQPQAPQAPSAPRSPAGTQPPAPPRMPHSTPTANAYAVASSLFPQVRITDWKRDPNSPLGRANPGSWHNDTEGALDVAPLPDMTFEQYVQTYKDAGYPILEARDEVKNPSKHATGKHWHVVLGAKPGDTAPGAPVPGAASDPMADHIGVTDGAGLPPKERVDNGQSAMLGFGDSAAFGFLDEAGAVADMVLGGPEGTETLWNSDKSLADIYRKNRDINRGKLKLAQDEDPLSFGLGGIAGAFVPGARLGKTVAGVNELSRAERFGKAVAEGGIMGGLYGAGSGEGGLDEHLDSIGEYGSYGVAGGAVLDGVVGTALDRIKTQPDRWAKREIERNPFAAYDAEIVADLKGATTNRAVSKGDPEGRATLTAKTINGIEQGYYADFKNGINALDIPEAEKLRLKEALTRKIAMSTEEANALRGTPAGDAVADAIIKTQRLRQLTPELKSKSGLLGKTAAVSDLMPIPGVIGRGLRMAARASGDGEAARVNAAEKLLNREKAYEKLGLQAGPSGQRESQAAFWEAVGQTAQAKEREAATTAAQKAETAFDKKARPIIREKVKGTEAEPVEVTEARKAMMKQAGRTATASERKLDAFDDQLNKPVAPKVDKPLTRKDRDALLRQIEDPALDERDITLPAAPSESQIRSKKATREKALAKLEGGLSDFDAQLDAPAPAKPVKGDAVDRMVERGIPGEFRAIDSLSTSTGLSRDDAMRVLDEIVKDDPTLAREINRLRLGHNTSDKRMGPTMRPLMRAKAQELGIAPKAADSVPVDEAAQARLAQGSDEAPPPGKPTQREMELEARIAELDPVQHTLADGTNTTQSQLGMLDEAAEAEVTGLRAELEQERQLRRVDRPQQWEQGRNRYQAQANDAISAMNADKAISADTVATMGNAPVQLRDNFKTTEEAERYIIDRVLPDLEADGATSSEIAAVRRYLMEIAQAKPYLTQAHFDAGTRQRRPGRQPSE